VAGAPRDDAARAGRGSMQAECRARDLWSASALAQGSTGRRFFRRRRPAVRPVVWSTAAVWPPDREMGGGDCPPVSAASGGGFPGQSSSVRACGAVTSQLRRESTPVDPWSGPEMRHCPGTLSGVSRLRALEAAARSWHVAPTPFAWGRKRALRCQCSRERRHEWGLLYMHAPPPPALQDRVEAMATRMPNAPRVLTDFVARENVG
jgi:hypothetical protein